MRLRSITVSLALTMVAVSGCGGSQEPTTSASSGSGLEKTDITVGTIPVVDTAPLQLAVDNGLFAAEGLNVKLQTLAGGAEAIPKLKEGTLDFSVGNYVSFFSAVANGAIDLKIVGDGSQSAPGSHVIMVPQDSPIKSIADLRDKKIAVNTRRNIATLLVRIAAEMHGVKLDEERNFVEFPLPEMENVLKAKQVDAAQVVEPFVTQISQSTGARTIWDTSQGPTKDFPIAGYAATTEFIEQNPKTVAAFQRAMTKAQELAADRESVIAAIPKYTRITPEVARSLAFVGFPTTVSATRLQRVADSMFEYKLLDKPLDAQKLVASVG